MVGPPVFPEMYQELNTRSPDYHDPKKQITRPVLI